jgi:YHS domain-containing protein
MHRILPAPFSWFVWAAMALLVATNARAADPPKLAIQGYDPVAYFTQKQPTQGKSEFTYDWDGLRYHFANAANRDRFAADPDHYAPNYAGNCAGTVATQGERVPANPKYWLVVDDKLYLFAFQKGPELFTKEPGLIKQADAKWSMIRKSDK